MSKRASRLVAVFMASIFLASAAQPSFAAFQIKLGQDAIPAEYRFIVAVGMRQNGSDEIQFFCSGSLVDDRHVVTAAHCLFDQEGRRLPDDNLIIAVGTVDLAFFEPAKGFAVKKSLPHPEYDPTEISNDIAVLTLTKPVSLSRVGAKAPQFAEPVMNDRPKAGSFVEIAGFGVAGEGRVPVERRLRDGTAVSMGQSRLQMARIPLVDLRTCQAALDKVPDDDGLAGLKVGDRQLCAGFADQSADACQGDSGGPILARGAKGEARLLGVVSFGIGCGRTGLFGIYTRLGGYAKWLRAALADGA